MGRSCRICMECMEGKDPSGSRKRNREEENFRNITGVVVEGSGKGNPHRINACRRLRGVEEEGW